MEREEFSIDAALNWAGGEHVVTVEPGIQRFPAQAAGVDGQHVAVTPPDQLGALRPVPFCGDGAWNMEDIIAGGKR